MESTQMNQSGIKEEVDSYIKRLNLNGLLCITHPDDEEVTNKICLDPNCNTLPDKL